MSSACLYRCSLPLRVKNTYLSLFLCGCVPPLSAPGRIHLAKRLGRCRQMTCGWWACRRPCLAVVGSVPCGYTCSQAVFRLRRSTAAPVIHLGAENDFQRADWLGKTEKRLTPLCSPSLQWFCSLLLLPSLFSQLWGC